MEDQNAKGLVKRDIVKIVTPGTVTDGAMLKENENNYLASVYVSKKGMGFHIMIFTGEINATEMTGTQQKKRF